MKEDLIEKISNLALTPETSESDIDHLMTLIRKLQDKSGKKRQTYPLLSFFCDWTKHLMLDRNSEGHKIINELNNVLFKLKDIQNSDLVIESISQVVSFTRLREELKIFLKTYKLPLELVTNKYRWNRLVVHIVNIISDSPLLLPERKRGEIKNSVKKGVIAISLQYSWINNKILYPVIEKTSEEVLVLIIEHTDTTRLVVPCKGFDGKYLTRQPNNET